MYLPDSLHNSGTELYNSYIQVYGSEKENGYWNYVTQLHQVDPGAWMKV
jgi:hypothetical protein